MVIRHCIRNSALAFCILRAGVLFGQDSIGEIHQFGLHFQTTYIYQYKPSFHSPYSGTNSLIGEKEEQNSITATLSFGVRLWKGAELYLNPELAGGSGLSGALGMAGSSNGETFRVGNPAPTLYKARYFLKQIFALGSEMEWQQEDADQLSGYIPRKRLSVYFGKFSLGDLLDNNEFSNSPRTQFINWALMNNGAWDYAANVRGYTYSLATELRSDKIAFKLALAALPKEANGDRLNLNFKDSFAIAVNAQVDREFSTNGKKGNLRFLLFYNNANMGSYSEALKAMGRPDIIATRKLGRSKTGIGISFDQELNNMAGLFGRAGWNDGKNETWAYAEIDRTFSIGLSLKGIGWKRKTDNGGVALLVNALSPDHKNYLANGGLGFMLGDGNLNYGFEEINEWYYNWKPSSKVPVWISADYQLVMHPGYNKDRGPVHIFSIRLHTEF